MATDGYETPFTPLISSSAHIHCMRRFHLYFPVKKSEAQGGQVLCSRGVRTSTTQCFLPAASCQAQC